MGDNIIFGTLVDTLFSPAQIFAYSVTNPRDYGVVEFSYDGRVKSIEEKPEVPKSKYAVPGLYFYDNKVVKIAKSLQPSSRGEYEITDINKAYLKLEELKVGIISRGIAWLDTGTFDSMSDASEYVRVIEKRQSKKIGCIEEVAFHMGYIDELQLATLAEKYAKSGYGDYLKNLIK